jgi:hypothetical protein
LVLLNKKVVVVAVIVVLITILIVLKYQNNIDDIVKNNASKGANMNITFSEMKSIAQPNWWIKPSNTTKNKVQNNQTKQVRSGSEPLSNFLILPDMNNWQLQENKKGIASATYQFKNLEDNNVSYELAIIRMNTKVGLNNVLSIWQNKVGIPINQSIESSVFSTKHKQNLDIFSFQGEQHTILVAVHKKQKYTFFRLSAVKHNNNKNSLLPNYDIAQKLETLLTDIYIHN